MSTYEQHLDTLLKRSEAEQEAYEKKRREQADLAATQIKDTYNAMIAAADEDYRRRAKQTADSYRSAYDANAVNELVARRHAEEAIANSNMANSGLNNTQHTAISLSRSRADYNTTAQKQAAVDAIMRELDGIRLQYQQKSADKQTDIYIDASEDAADYMTAREKAARDDAYDLYRADKEVEKAALEAMKHTGGSRYAQSNKPSYTAVKTDAMLILKREGNLAAETFLTQCVNNGYITERQKSELMTTVGVRVTEKPSETVVRATAMRLKELVDANEAYQYVKTLYDNGMIGIRLAETLYDELGVG